VVILSPYVTSANYSLITEVGAGVFHLLDGLSPVRYNLAAFYFGPVAQLGARFNRTEEAAGSNPARSTGTPCLEYLHHTGFEHAANSKSVSGLTSMIPDYQALSIAICQKFERMSKVAGTGDHPPAWSVAEYTRLVVLFSLTLTQ
jgi:hypothetical protein